MGTAVPNVSPKRAAPEEARIAAEMKATIAIPKNPLQAARSEEGVWGLVPGRGVWGMESPNVPPRLAAAVPRKTGFCSDTGHAAMTWRTLTGMRLFNQIRKGSESP